MATAAPEVVRPFAEVRELMLERARGRKNPFLYTNPDEVERVRIEKSL